jgi:hypothetical protein
LLCKNYSENEKSSYVGFGVGPKLCRSFKLLRDHIVTMHYTAVTALPLPLALTPIRLAQWAPVYTFVSSQSPMLQ